MCLLHLLSENIFPCIKGRVPPFLHKVVLRRANQPHNSHEDRFSMLWPSRTQSPPKSQITMVKVSGKHIWCHQICLPDTLTIVIWFLGGDCVRLGQSIEKRSSWELWGWFALLKTTLCKKGGTLPLRSNWFYVLMKQKWIWNLSLCYFSLFCFYLTGYDARTAERKSDSTWRTWYKQSLRVYHSRRTISWLIPEMQYPVIYVIKFSNN